MIRFLLLSLSLLLLTVPTHGFAPPFLPTTNTRGTSLFTPHHSTHVQLSMLAAAQESSEWYSPPPEPVAPLQHGSNAHAVVTTIRSATELQEYLEADPERVTVIKFHASWCKSCQKFGQKFHQLASHQADWHDPKQDVLVHAGAARFAAIEWGANTALCRHLGVQKLPTVYFYRGTEQLTGFAAGPSKMQTVKDTLQYLQDAGDRERNMELKLVKGQQLVQDVVLPKQLSEQAARKQQQASAATSPPTAAAQPPLSTRSAASSDTPRTHNKPSKHWWNPW